METTLTTKKHFDRINKQSSSLDKIKGIIMAFEELKGSMSFEKFYNEVKKEVSKND